MSADADIEKEKKSENVASCNWIERFGSEFVNTYQGQFKWKIKRAYYEEDRLKEGVEIRRGK